LREQIFDLEAIRSNAFYADDIWLKCIELCDNIPTVLAHNVDIKLRSIYGTVAKKSLAQYNILENANDIQLKATCDYLKIDLYKKIGEYEK
jgi:hypothetical protein